MLNSNNNKRHFVHTDPEPTPEPDLAALHAEYLRCRAATQRLTSTKQHFWLMLAPATTAAKCSFTMLSFAALFWGCLFLDTTLFSYFPFAAVRVYHPGIILCLLAVCSLVDQQWLWPHGWSVLSFVHLCTWSILLVLALAAGSIGPVVGLLFAQVLIAGHLVLCSLYILREMRQKQLVFHQQKTSRQQQVPLFTHAHSSSLSTTTSSRHNQAALQGMTDTSLMIDYTHSASEDIGILDFPLPLNKTLLPQQKTTVNPPKSAGDTLLTPANPTSFLRH